MLLFVLLLLLSLLRHPSGMLRSMRHVAGPAARVVASSEMPLLRKAPFFMNPASAGARRTFLTSVVKRRVNRMLKRGNLDLLDRFFRSRLPIIKTVVRTPGRLKRLGVSMLKIMEVSAEVHIVYGLYKGDLAIFDVGSLDNPKEKEEMTIWETIKNFPHRNLQKVLTVDKDEKERTVTSVLEAPLGMPLEEFIGSQVGNLAALGILSSIGGAMMHLWDKGIYYAGPIFDGVIVEVKEGLTEENAELVAKMVDVGKNSYILGKAGIGYGAECFNLSVCRILQHSFPEAVEMFKKREEMHAHFAAFLLKTLDATGKESVELAKLLYQNIRTSTMEEKNKERGTLRLGAASGGDGILDSLQRTHIPDPAKPIIIGLLGVGEEHLTLAQAVQKLEEWKAQEEERRRKEIEDQTRQTVKAVLEEKNKKMKALFSWLRGTEGEG